MAEQLLQALTVIATYGAFDAWMTGDDSWTARAGWSNYVYGYGSTSVEALMNLASVITKEATQ